MRATLAAENRISERIAKHCTRKVFAPLSGVPVGTLNRWLAEDGSIPRHQGTSLLDLLDSMDSLAYRTSPVKVDWEHEDMPLVLKKFRLGRLLAPKTLDHDPDGSLVREELERMRQRWDAGIASLARQIQQNEPEPVD